MYPCMSLFIGVFTNQLLCFEVDLNDVHPILDVMISCSFYTYIYRVCMMLIWYFLVILEKKIYI